MSNMPTPDVPRPAISDASQSHVQSSITRRTDCSTAHADTSETRTMSCANIMAPPLAAGAPRHMLRLRSRQPLGMPSLSALTGSPRTSPGVHGLSWRPKVSSPYLTHAGRCYGCPAALCDCLCKAQHVEQMHWQSTVQTHVLYQEYKWLQPMITVRSPGVRL